MQESSEGKRDPRLKTLFIASLLFCAFHLFVHWRAPVHDGDSFEYAGIARNFYRTGALREDLLRNYCVRDQPLPHPPALRANLYSLSLVPFYAVFRATQWTFLVPAFIGIFILPLVTYRAGKRLFSESTGFYAALLSLLSPSLLRQYTFLDPGLPEVWQMIFYLLFVLALTEERYARAGFMMGLALAFKRNSAVLIPAAAIWLLIFRRKKTLGAAAGLFGAALIVVMPFLVRNFMVFNDPFYTEQFAGVSRVFGGMMQDRLADGDLFGIIFNYEAYNEAPDPSPANAGEKLDAVSRVLTINLKAALLGGKSSILYIPGILQVFCSLLLPFMLFQSATLKKSPATVLVSLIIILQVVMHAAVPIYSDRYLLCVLPLAFLVSAEGLNRAQNLLSRGGNPLPVPPPALGLVLFVLLTESAGFFVLNATRLLEPASESTSRELETTCRYIQDNTPPDAVIMTFPFLSTHFFCDRPTVPLPYGSIVTMAKVIKKYGAGHVIYTRVWPGDLFPNLPFADAVAHGRRVSLLKVNAGRLDEYLEKHGDFHVDALNPVGYFLSKRFDFEAAPPLYKILTSAVRNALLGFGLYLAAAAAFVYFFMKRGFLRRGLPVLTFALFVLLADLAYLGNFMKPFAGMNPQVSMVEAELFLKSLGRDRPPRLIVSGREGEAQRAANALQRLFETTSVLTAGDYVPDADTMVFLPVPPAGIALSNDAAFANAVEIEFKLKKRVDEIVSRYACPGCSAQPVRGGVFVYRR
ncbi:MAG: glycosyltransferase family 39 protein [bacterium]